eukprot:127591_1
MDSLENSIGRTPIAKKVKKPRAKAIKCSWCDRKRARNDLCNVCRQKVESRARRLMEQKIGGDMDCLQKVMQYFQNNIPLNSLKHIDLIELISESFPFLMLKFQTEKTYKGKKGNRCWCLPESVLKKLMASVYDKDTQSSSIVKQSSRQELCSLLMSTVTQSFAKYDISVEEITSTNSSEKPHSLKRRKMTDECEMNDAPPMKRARVDDTNHNTNNERIWGRSDTELLSFDITKLDSFLLQFEQKVLNGNELERVEPSERIDFLKKRCKEFVKILNELRDYVMHLRTGGVDTNHQESHDGSLLRCTTNLLSKLSVNPVERIELLKNNIPKLEEYHNLGCNELWETVRSIESVGSQMGCERQANSSLKQYTTAIELKVLRDRYILPTLKNQTTNHNHAHTINTYTVPPMTNLNTFRPPPQTNVQTHCVTHPNTVNRRPIAPPPAPQQQQQMIFAPITSSYALVNNSNHGQLQHVNHMNVDQSCSTHRLPLNTSTLNALGITVPIISSNINPGQHLPTTFNFDLF